MQTITPVSRRKDGKYGAANREISAIYRGMSENWRAIRKLNPLKDPKVDITIIKRYYYDNLRRWYAWDIHPALQLIYADFVTLVGREAVKEVQKLVGVDGGRSMGDGHSGCR